MTLPIQRVPRFLGQILSTFGGQTPGTLAEEARGVLDLLQFYGNTQIQNVSVTNGVLAETGSMNITVPDGQHWILFGMHMLVAKTATMTALRFAIGYTTDPNVGAGNRMFVAETEGGPFGATETGGVRCCWQAPYPRVLGPGSGLTGILDILGTDATASCFFNANVGVLG